MSSTVTRTIAQLEAECKKLGLTVNMVGKKLAKSDYVTALRNNTIAEQFPNGLPEALSLMLAIESPMLCSRYQNLKPEQQEAIWTSPDWYAEEKMDGARMLVYFGEGGFDFYSRNISVTDYLPISYKETLWTDYVDVSKITHRFLIDCEIISTEKNISTIVGKHGVITENQLQAVTALMALRPDLSIKIQQELAPIKFISFDILWLDGEWLIDKPLVERRKALKIVMAELVAAGMNVGSPLSNYSNRRQFYKALIKAGREGCVFKNIHSPYIPSSNRAKDGWIKVKRSMSESSQLMGFGDTIDAYVSGFEEADEGKSWAGLVGVLVFSVTLKDANGNEQTHEIAKVSSLTQELRERVTTQVDGRPVLKSEYYGKVASLDGQCISARSKRLRHAVIVEWRPDRDATSCVLDEEFMNSMIL